MPERSGSSKYTTSAQPAALINTYEGKDYDEENEQGDCEESDCVAPANGRDRLAGTVDLDIDRVIPGADSDSSGRTSTLDERRQMGGRDHLSSVVY